MKASRVRYVAAPFLFLLALVPGAASEDSVFLRGMGLAFPYAIPEHGQSLEIVGRIEPSESQVPYPLLPGGWEYTWTLTGPVVHRVEAPASGIRFLDLTFGVLEIREDPSANSAYLPDPPNEAVPSTFHDGEILLLGTVTDLRIRDIFGLVTATGNLRFVGGSALPELEESLVWAFDAAVSVYGGGIPAGYGSAWNIELAPREPVSIEASSWGGIKGLYR